MLAETDAGAVYVTAVGALLVKVPQALPEQPEPDIVQVTPLPLESLLTEAVKFKVCPRSMLV